MRTNGSKTSRSDSPWDKVSHRFTAGGQAVLQGLSNFSDDMRLLLRRGRNGAVLRQRQLEGFHMLVRAEEGVGRNIYFKGIHEREESAFFRSLIGDNSICVDVGANIGYFSLLFASLCPRGSVHSFEPVPLNYHILCINILLNGFTNMTASPCAVGDAEGSVDFVVSRDSAFSSLVDTGREPVAERIVVPMTNLDSYCESHQLGRVDVLKVDVEGAENAVLSGGRRLFSDHARKPRIVLLEVYEPMLKIFRQSSRAILEQMRAYGYRPFLLDGGQRIEFDGQLSERLYNVFFETSRES